MREELREIVREHHQTLCDEVSLVAVALDQWLEEGGVLDPTRQLVHKIKGSAGSIGFPEITAKALALESALKPVRDSVEDEQTTRKIRHRLEELQAEVARSTPESSSLYHYTE